MYTEKNSRPHGINVGDFVTVRETRGYQKARFEGKFQSAAETLCILILKENSKRENKTAQSPRTIPYWIATLPQLTHCVDQMISNLKQLKKRIPRVLEQGLCS
ncbi:hypothetical protein JTE90_010333 [Oedothorax gibbosus]|uniref:Uncharacterized protein n=1 Tax=Oedothorax gibbosus TaxID=931172 RepID=A0AAV6TR08_9ARAC|nr:hypothetical protein JTE90_010333 [Oedothorax gibbosus]